MKLVSRLFDFEREETQGERLFFRAFEGYILLRAADQAWEWGRTLQQIDRIVAPAGIARWIDLSFMLGAAGIVNALAITLLLAAGFVRRGRFAYLAALALLHVQYCARWSLGKTPHGAVLLGLCLLALGLAFAAFSTPRNVRRAALGLCCFFTGVAYTSAAGCKLVATGPGWVDGRHLWLWMAERGVDMTSETGAYGPSWLQSLLLQRHALSTSVLSAGLLAELGAIGCWSRRLRPLVMTLLLGMHLGIGLSMDIYFRINMEILALLAYPWATAIDRLLSRTSLTAAVRRVK